MIDITSDFARQQDETDPLAAFRAEFAAPDPSLIYLDGNSLGRLPHAAVERLLAAINREWGEWLIRGWNQGWYEKPHRLGDLIAPLIGADVGQVVVSDSTSINLYKLTMAALEARPTRTGIVTDAFNFPSDLYIMQGCVTACGGRHRLTVVDSPDGITMPTEAICDAISDETALVSLSHVTFKSGWMHDAAAITAHAHAKGALVLWDLSHSTGAVPVELEAWGADLAVGCTYKYLNGGPGAPAFLYVRRDLQEQLLSPIWGWFGQDQPFDFSLDYTPAPDISRFLVGTPPVLSLVALEPALEILNRAGMTALRAKSVALSEYLIALAEARLSTFGVSIGSPRNPAQRGSHVALRHPDSYRLVRALIEEVGVLPDFRAPDNVRFGIAPLYNSFADIWGAVERLERVLAERLYERYPATRLKVT